MSVALRVFDELTEAGEDRTRARVIADALERLEERYPQLKEVATRSDVRETELRLQKEVKEVEAKLQKEIKEVELKLTREIESVRLEIKEVEVRLTQAIHRQTLWMIGSVGAVVGGIRLLEWFLAHIPPT